MPTPRPDYVGYDVSGRESWCKDELPHLRIRHRVGNIQSPLTGFAQNLLSRHASPVITHLNHNRPTLMRGGKCDGAGFGLAGSNAVGGQLDSVVATITNQVRQRIGNFLDQSLCRALWPLPWVTKSTFFPSLLAKSRNIRGNRLKYN